jgi:Ni/Co efflux regulator RcnB
MKRIIIPALATLSLAAPSALLADPGHGKGHDKAAAHEPHHGARTPPGLAKKPYGMPPGQAKKLWAQGQRLPTSYMTQRYYVPEARRVSLGPTPYGYRWIQVGDQYYLAETRSGLVARVLAATLR